MYECDNCRRKWNRSQLKPPQRLFERLDDDNPTMPDGECPDCGALCYSLNNGAGVTVSDLIAPFDVDEAAAAQQAYDDMLAAAAIRGNFPKYDGLSPFVLGATKRALA